MASDKIFVHFSQVFNPHDEGRALYGSEMDTADVIEDGYIAVKDGKILAVGSGEPASDLVDDHTEVIDCTGKFASPGLIDCHTHLVYGGSREHEFAKKLNGMSYLEILNEGGGILSTVKSTREAGFDELVEKTENLLSLMLRHGVTTVEAKSGYGLDWENEEKQMRVVEKLNETQPIELVSTFMAAHAIPEEYHGDGDKYIDDVIAMLPKVKEENLAEFCDVFCEQDVFTAEQSKRLLEAAKELGFGLRIHSDEIATIGGVDVAAEIPSNTAEHLMKITDEGVKKLAESKVIGDVLPGTTFSLMEDTYAPAKKMIEAGMAITLSTDSNPGSCPMANMQFIMQLGCFQLHLTPIQVYNAVTINAAYAAGRGDTVGSFKEGKRANITIFDAPNLDYTLYFFATNLAQDVLIDGEYKVKNFEIVK